MNLLRGLREFLGWKREESDVPVDQEENWPEAAGTMARLFYPRPGDAVRALEEALDQLRCTPPGDEQEEVLSRGLRALEALELGSDQWRLRLATGGRLGHGLVEACEAMPELFDQPSWCRSVERLEETFFESTDRLLVLWARALSRARERARERTREDRRGRGKGPAPEPWMCRRSSDLSPRLAYRLLLEDCLGPGDPGPREQQVLELLAILFGISPGLHATMTEEVREQVRRGRLRRNRPFETRNYYQRLYLLARSGGRLSPESRELLVRVGNALGITQEEFESIRRRVARQVGEPPPAPVPEVRAPARS